MAAVTALAAFWAFWGSIEAFHEGWNAPTLVRRLLWVAAYLGPALVLVLLGTVAVRWPRAGGLLFIAAGGLVIVLVQLDRASIAPSVLALLAVIPIVIGLLFLGGGELRHRRLATWLVVGLPALTAIACGAGPAYRVATRYDDGERGARRVDGNGVSLVWAPAGPGWGRDEMLSWEQARERCRKLSADGLSVSGTLVDAWRLPTVDELVASLTFRGENAGGHWDPVERRATYRLRPEKESPLWDPRGTFPYLWTATEVDAEHAYMVVYHGGVFAREKGHGGIGFRAVRAP